MSSAFWATGTATFTEDETEVEGQDTSWLLAGIRAGDRIESDDGRSATILSVEDQGEIVLDKPWRGAGQTAGPYKIWRTLIGPELWGAAQELMQRLAAPNLLALAGLDGTGGDKLLRMTGDGTMDAVAAKLVFALAGLDGTGGDKLGYMTGDGTMAETAFTDAARTLLAGANAADMRAVLQASSLRETRVFTSAAAFVKPDWLQFVIVNLWNGGGGSAAVVATASGQAAAAGGGGSGGFARVFMLASALASSTTVTVGAAGGASNFGSHIVGNGGGSAGSTQSSGSTPSVWGGADTAGPAPTVNTGTPLIVSKGTSGDPAIRTTGAAINSGSGGSAPWGGAGGGAQRGNHVNGYPGQWPGGGAGGGCNIGDQSATSFVPGAAGGVIVEMYGW